MSATLVHDKDDKDNNKSLSFKGDCREWSGLFCKLNKSNAIMLEIKKTDKDILMLNEKANVTPSNAECDRVSPKYDKRRHTTKHPSGPVTIAIPIPAIKALTKKSSNIIL